MTVTTDAEGTIITDYDNDGKTALISAYAGAATAYGRVWVHPANNKWAITYFNPKTTAAIKSTQLNVRFFLLKLN